MWRSSLLFRPCLFLVFFFLVPTMSWKLPKKYDTSFRVSSLRADEIFRLPAAGTQGACNDRMINAVIEQTRYLLRYTIEKKINKINTQSPSQSAPDKVLAAYKVAIPLLGVAKKDLQADKIVLSFDSQLQLKYFKGEFQYDCNVVGLADPDCEENYVRALAALSKSPDTYPLGNLACNDELFQWEPVLSDYYAGWYSIPQWGIRYSVSKDEVAKTPGWDPANGPCGEHLPGEGEILGFVRPDLEMIILCESMWHLPHQDLDRLQDELKDLPSGTSVDELLTPAGAFLHEMMHFVEQRGAV